MGILLVDLLTCDHLGASTIGKPCIILYSCNMFKMMVRRIVPISYSNGLFGRQVVGPNRPDEDLHMPELKILPVWVVNPITC